MLIPFLHSDSHFDCFLHKARGYYYGVGLPRYRGGYFLDGHIDQFNLKLWCQAGYYAVRSRVELLEVSGRAVPFRLHVICDLEPESEPPSPWTNDKALLLIAGRDG